MEVLLKRVFFGLIGQRTGPVFSDIQKGKSSYGWLLPPLVLFLAIIELSLIHTTVFTRLLPLVIAAFSLLLFVYKSLGLFIIYTALFFWAFFSYQEIAPEECLWQMALLYTTAVNFFIALLCLEKAEEQSLYLHKEMEEKGKKWQEALDQYTADEKKYREYIDSLKETVQELTRELEQRRIDRIGELRQLELLKAEIALVNEQKQALVSDAFTARAEAKEHLIHLEKMMEKAVEPPQVIEVQKVVEVPVIVEVPVKENGEYLQLRKQFAEKSEMLSAKRKELFAVETKLLTMQKEQELLSSDDLSILVKSLQQDLLVAAETERQLEEEIALLSTLISKDL